MRRPGCGGGSRTWRSTPLCTLTALMWESRHVAHHVDSCLSGRLERQALPEAQPCEDSRVA